MKTFILFMLLVGSVLAQDFPAGVYPGTKAESLPPREPRLLFITAKWCTPCHVAMDGPTGFRKWLQASGWVIDETNRAHVQLVDFDSNPELAQKHKVMQLPAVVVIDGEHHDAIPYVDRVTFANLIAKPKAKATLADGFDLKRVGCKLRPDLGSGVNTDQGVVTCWHCVKDGKPIEVECDGETARGTVVAYDAAADVAILSVPWKKPHPAVSLAATIDSPQILKCVARSAEGPLAISLHSLSWSDTVNGNLVVGGAFIAGQSGGGLINTNGDLVGIVSGNIVDAEPFRGLVIPATAIQQLLGRLAR